MPAITRPARLTDQAVEFIRAAIIGGKLRAGELYNATELGNQLGVSRTPVREALLELARRGLVEIEPNRGARILSTSAHAFVEIFQLRLMLEVPLSRQAVLRKNAESEAEVEAAYSAFERAAAEGDGEQVLRADRDFHRALLAGAGNERASRMLVEQRDFVLQSGVGTVPHARSAAECFADHADIMAAYRAGDSGAIGPALGRHIANTAHLLIAQEARTRAEFAQVNIAAEIDDFMPRHR